MKKTFIKVVIGLLVLLFGCFIVIQRRRPQMLRPNELFDTKRTNEFRRIEFEGQQRKIIVTNKAVLEPIAAAFRNPQERGAHGGTTYDSVFTLEDGSLVRAFVNIYDTLDGFSVTIPRRSGVFDADPYYFNVSLSDPVNQDVRKVFKALKDESNIGKQITF